MELSDSEVMARAVCEPELFVHVFDRHGRAVHAYLARRAGSQAADDVMGEVWLQAFRSRDRFNTNWSDARPWLYGIARNALRAHWRSRYRGERHTHAGSADPWEDVDVRLDAARRAPTLRAALAALPDKDLEVLLLVAWEQLSPTEAAVSLGVPAGTVRWRLHRARASLRRQLGDDLGDVNGFETVMEV